MSGYNTTHNYRRPRWPPHVLVEDEDASLTKEYMPIVLEDHIPCRGTIDGALLEPIETETRFVLLTDLSRSTSDAAKGRRRRPFKEEERKPRHSDRLDPNDDALPMLETRQPSPYSFARTDTGRLVSDDKTKVSAEQKSRSDKKSTKPISRYSDDEYEVSNRGNKGKQKNVAFDDRSTRDPDISKKSETRRPPTLDTSKKRPVTPLEIPRDPIIDIINNAGPKLTHVQSAQTPRTPLTPRGSTKDNDDDYLDHRHHSLPNNTPYLSPVGDSRSSRGDRSPRPGSKSNSPMESYGFDYPSTQKKRTQPTSTPYPDFEPSRGSSLPYPEESHPMVMPDQHHFISDLLAEAEAGASSSSTKKSAPPITRKISTKQTREPPSPVTSRTTPSSSQGSNRLSGSALTLLPIPKELDDIPPCPRNFFSTEEHGWHQSRQIKDYDVCETCFGNMILPTKFRDDFHLGRRYNPNTPIRCDFGDSLVRQAWLMTIKEGMHDLSLLSKLAKVSTSKRLACPDKILATSPWYVILDDTGRPVQGFQICPTDRSAIEALFPALKGWFVPLSSSSLPALCSLRQSSRRSAKLLSMLESLQQRAVVAYSTSLEYGRTSYPDFSRSSSYVDIHPLLTLIRKNSRALECPRDCAMPGLIWHYLYNYPEYPVCPECYDEVIAEDAKIGLPLAIAFTGLPRSVPSSAQARLAPGSLHGIPDGFTCCLYSDRMRNIWRETVRIDDESAIKLWLREVKERRRKEIDYASRKADLLKREGSVRSELLGMYTGKDDAWIRDQRDKVEEAWAKIE
jgi:hypothetical protein